MLTEGVFSRALIKQKALEIAGTSEVNIYSPKHHGIPGRIDIEVKCEDEQRFLTYKNWVKDNQPIGAIVNVYRTT